MQTQVNSNHRSTEGNKVLGVVCIPSNKVGERPRRVIPSKGLTPDFRPPVVSSPITKKDKKEDKIQGSNTLSSSPSPYNSCEVLLGRKEIPLKPVRGEEILVSYEIYGNEDLISIDWEEPLPNAHIKIQIMVGAAPLCIHMSPSCMERRYTEEGMSRKAVFRQATDSRGYHDTYVLSSWSVNDLCFYLRTNILNHIVDNDSRSPYLDIWKAIVWRQDILRREHFTKISGSEYTLSKDEVELLSHIEITKSKFELEDF